MPSGHGKQLRSTVEAHTAAGFVAPSVRSASEAIKGGFQSQPDATKASRARWADLAVVTLEVALRLAAVSFARDITRSAAAAGGTDHALPLHASPRVRAGRARDGACGAVDVRHETVQAWLAGVASCGSLLA